MSSPGRSGGTIKPPDLFQDLWRQLGECHQSALRELEEKVGKLKKERCLDAQRLEVFYNRNQHLKEQTKTMQETISLLEDRLRAGACDRCSILEEDLRASRDQNERLITSLKNERNQLEDENRKLQAELQKLQMFHSKAQQMPSPEQEDGIIPDSPILTSSLPVANKLKKRKNTDQMRHVRYEEMPPPKFNHSLFNAMNKEAQKNPGSAEVLVPNTCELDSSQILKDENMEVVIAETCALELLCKPSKKTRSSASQQSSSISPQKYDIQLKSVERVSSCKAKRKTACGEPVVWEKDKMQTSTQKRKESQTLQCEPGTSASLSIRSLKKEPCGSKVLSPKESANQTQNTDCASPAFKKPNGTVKDLKRIHLLDRNASHGPDTKDDERKHRRESTWSIDPAFVLSVHEDEQGGDEKEEHGHSPSADTDCTWVSHSLLQGRGENAQDRGDDASGTGEKANDSFDRIFDATAYGEYKSYHGSQISQSQADDDEEEEEEEEEGSPEKTPGHSRMAKARHPTFAHVAVVRKKDERRKLKGTTCKECETYYAQLPEEEKQKKLSACSRHRFLYIPPCTPENFWEVGFPSTQTCIERGYIKEEKNPQVRLRRREPFKALFSPRSSQQES
ncbi:DNA endonuclease RBBP8 [Aulostomus maculatus]